MLNVYQISFWTLIAVGVTAIAYLGQLLVLVLIYFRVIREADRNAKIREQEIAKAGDMMLEKGKELTGQMNDLAKRNTFILAIMAAAKAILVLSARSAIHKVERGKNHER